MLDKIIASYWKKDPLRGSHKCLLVHRLEFTDYGGYMALSSLPRLLYHTTMLK